MTGVDDSGLVTASLFGAASAVLPALFLLFGQVWERDSPRAGLVQGANIITG